MDQMFLRTTHPTKDKITLNHFLLFKISCILIVALLIAGFLSETAQAATGLTIYDYTTKKEFTYCEKLVKITLNGEAIDNTKTPGILKNGIAMVAYNDVFQKTDIAAECVYNKTKGTLSISKYGTTIKMTIGSTKATVNGKAAILPVAPMKVKYSNAGIVKVLVPSRFISETFGLGYTWNSTTGTVAIVKNTLRLSYNSGKAFEYTGAQGQVTIDGKKVNLGTMPSIITNNTAMLCAKKVFADSAIGAKYQYNSSDKTITLSKGGNVLTMTIGSTIATFNGKSKMLDTAPILVTNQATEASYVMIPGGFTAACLGYNYEWNNTKRTSVITSRKDDSPNTGGTGNSSSSPELSGEGVVIETGTILKQWSGLDNLYHSSSDVRELNSDSGTITEPGLIYAVNRDYSNPKQNTEVFMIASTKPFGKITASHSGKTLKVLASDTSCIDQTYQAYGVFSNYVTTVGTYSNDNNGTSIEFEILPEKYSYDIKLSPDNQMLYVTVYLNTVTSAVVGTNSSGDYLTLTGLKPLDISITNSTGIMTIDLPYTINGLGDIYSEITSSRYMKFIYAYSTAEKTQLSINLSEGYEYYTSQNGNQVTISFQTAGGTPVQPTPAPQPDPETPVVIDKSKYEIVIPKPEGITRTMITDEDYYFDQNFVIRLSGDYTQYFNSNPIKKSSSVIDDISVSLNGSYQTEIKIETKKLQGYEIAVDDKNIYINVGNPKEIYKNIVVLDPGHGGGAQGAEYFNTYEKDINYKILYTIGKNYFNQNTSKLKVYYTRISDVDMTLSNRAAFASQYGADLFVSLHMNASTSSAAYGTEVYYSESNNKANNAGLTSKALATLFVNNLTNQLGTYNRGAKTERYTVVYKNTVPAVLIELGFLSNKNDFASLSDETFQNNAANTIYETLLQVFEAYPTGR